MSKRAAMLMAAGVVLALLGGSVALSFGLSGGNSAAADPSGEPERVVRTIHRTVRVEKPAKDAPVEVVTVATGSGATAPATSAVANVSGDEAWDDDAYEGEDHEDGEHEDGEHEGEDHEDGGDDDGGWHDD